VDTVSDTSATREVLFVVGVALLGVLLALVTVVTPWYSGPIASTGPEVVDLHVPQPANVAVDFGVAHPG
jgi:hypothetical protein